MEKLNTNKMYIQVIIENRETIDILDFLTWLKVRKILKNSPESFSGVAIANSNGKYIPFQYSNEEIIEYGKFLPPLYDFSKLLNNYSDINDLLETFYNKELHGAELVGKRNFLRREGWDYLTCLLRALEK